MSSGKPPASTGKSANDGQGERNGDHAVLSPALSAAGGVSHSAVSELPRLKAQWVMARRVRKERSKNPFGKIQSRSDWGVERQSR
jgi:hypothetical protein